jgi:hypothetical protein
MCCISNQPSRSDGAKTFLLAYRFYKYFVPPGLQTDQRGSLICSADFRDRTLKYLRLEVRLSAGARTTRPRRRARFSKRLFAPRAQCGRGARVPRHVLECLGNSNKSIRSEKWQTLLFVRNQMVLI